MVKTLQTLIETSRRQYRTMTEMVAATLREAIIGGALGSGEMIRQDQLAAAFGVSRMPVREALRQLEAEGLVEFLPHRGAVVAELKPDEILEMCEIRSLLECHALKKAVPKLSEDVLRRAECVLDELDEENDVARWGEMNQRFHMTLYDNLRGTRLYDLVAAQYQHLDRYIRVTLTQLDYAGKSQAEHRMLVAACRAGDPDRAAEVLRGHLAKSAGAIAELLAGQQALAGAQR